MSNEIQLEGVHAGAAYVEDLHAMVFSIEYVFKDRMGIVSMPDFSVTNMRSTINYFKKIDENVRQIRCCGADIDRYYEYQLLKSGWVCRNFERIVKS